MDDRELTAAERESMVRDQIERRGIHAPRLLAALRSTPRHWFVPPEHQLQAYSDGPLPIGLGQTISQPYIVALMTEALELRGPERVLEIGTGSGYQAAILGQLAAEVHTVERHAALALNARLALEKLGLSNVTVHIGDGSQGLPEFAPYQAIMVTAGAPEPPPPLFAQLADGGRLVIPVGSWGSQMLEVWQRQGGELQRQALCPVAFVPLRGEHGWTEDKWRRE
jgi:protein-L-isoaspartate(D-aspartate) O-methyltransferase